MLLRGGESVELSMRRGERGLEVEEGLKRGKPLREALGVHDRVNEEVRLGEQRRVPCEAAHQNRLGGRRQKPRQPRNALGGLSRARAHERKKKKTNARKLT